MVNEMNWFVETIEKRLSVNVDRSHISFEGHELYLDEIDESLIPEEVLTGLPETIIV